MSKIIKTACYAVYICVIVNILIISTDKFTWAAQPISLTIEAGSVDYTPYDALLKKHVKNGIVGYDGFKQDESILNAHLNEMEQVRVANLSRDAQLAFYINLYNAWTVKLILTRWPAIKSIKEFSTLFRTPWERPLVQLQGKVLTLDDVEHGIIRPQFADYRIHFAVNCSAISCPPLASEAFTGEHLQAQLEDAARAFINSPAGVRVQGDTVYVSQIFKWYSEDFTPSVEAVIRHYAGPELTKSLNELPSPVKIQHLNYDWQLNGNPS